MSTAHDAKWLKVDGNAIPEELKEREQWVCWRALPGEPGKKLRKVPYDPVKRRNAKATDSDTWNWWGLCWHPYLRRYPYFAGVGFEFSADDPYTGIDLDKCRNPETGEIHPAALEVLAKIKSYAEVSPTGTGVKLIIRGKLPAGIRNKAALDGIEFEVYDHGRYFALTGHVIDDEHRNIIEAQDALDGIVARIQTAQTAKAAPKPETAARSDEDVFRRAVKRAISIRYADENDGSRRLLKVAIISVEMDLSETDAIRLVNEVHRLAPFPSEFSEADILRRLRDAETKTTRGKGLNQAPPVTAASTATPLEKFSLVYVDARTEVANARRFIHRHGAELRYCAPWEKWLVWDGTRWQVDQTRRTETMAKAELSNLWDEVARICKAEGTTETIKQAVTGFAKSSNSANGVRNTLSLARSEPGVPILPDALDSHPWLLNTLSGTVDLRTGHCRPHDRADLLTKLAPVEYDPAATCPRWLAFLDRIMQSNGSLIGFLQRAVGMSLTGIIRDHVLLVAYGTGRNGKSVFLGTLQRMLGDDYGMKAAADLLMTKGKGDSHPTERADLFGKRFISCIEVDDGKRLAESLVKELTGGDRVRARRMREDFWEFPPQHHLWLAVNHKPVVRGTDEGIWRRLKLIPFAVTITDQEQDDQLPEKLADELPGILAWAVQGARDWHEYGLGEPDEVKAATACYRGDMDTLGEFLDEVCEVAACHSVSAGDLYAAYAKWSEASGEYVHSKRKLGLLLVERGFDRFRNNGPHYRGLTIKQHLNF